MSAKKQGKGTNVIFTPDGGSAFTGVFGAAVDETGQSAPGVDANEIDSDYIQRDAPEVVDLGGINCTVYHNPESPAPRRGVKGVLRIEDPLTNPLNGTRAFRQGDAWVEESNTIKRLTEKMITSLKITFTGTNYTEGNEGA